MSLHVGEQLSINVTQGQIHKSEKKEEKNQEKKKTQMNRTKKKLNGAIWWLYRECCGEVVRAQGW